MRGPFGVEGPFRDQIPIELQYAAFTGVIVLRVVEIGAAEKMSPGANGFIVETLVMGAPSSSAENRAMIAAGADSTTLRHTLIAGPSAGRGVRPPPIYHNPKAGRHLNATPAP